MTLAAISISIRTLVMLCIGAIILWRLGASLARRPAYSILLLVPLIAVGAALLLAGSPGPTGASRARSSAAASRQSLAIRHGDPDAHENDCDPRGLEDMHRADDPDSVGISHDIRVFVSRDDGAVAVARERGDARVFRDAFGEEHVDGTGGAGAIESPRAHVTIAMSRVKRGMTRAASRSERGLDRVRGRLDQFGQSRAGWIVLSAIAFAALLYLGYLLLDASTRGHFSWSLRIVAIITFGVMIAAVSALN